MLDPSKRLTASQALAHSWVKGTAKSEHMEEAQTKLKQFNAKRKLRVSKAAALTYSPAVKQASTFCIPCVGLQRLEISSLVQLLLS